MQKITFVVGVAIALILGGAGCDSLTDTSTSPTTVPTTTTSTAAMLGTTEFTATAESSDPDTLVVRWNKPANTANGNTFRVLHSASAEPVLPTAYWYERSSGDAVEAEVSGVPAGVRYVRVCEFNGKKCVRYSNTVKVTVE